jgi:hypothetical protein
LNISFFWSKRSSGTGNPGWVIREMSGIGKPERVKFDIC